MATYPRGGEDARFYYSVRSKAPVARDCRRLPGLAEGTLAVNLGLAGWRAVVTGAGKGIGLAVTCALTSAAGCHALMDAAAAHLGGIELLVNNVGGVQQQCRRGTAAHRRIPRGH